MGFRQGAFAKLWKVEDKGNYSVAQVSVSRKNKDTGRYEVEFQDGFVRLVGNAHETAKGLNIPESIGLSIKITSCDVTNKYDAEKGKSYINFTIFGFEIPDNNNGSATINTKNSKNSSKSSKASAKVDNNSEYETEDELPF